MGGGSNLPCLDGLRTTCRAVAHCCLWVQEGKEGRDECGGMVGIEDSVMMPK